MSYCEGCTKLLRELRAAKERVVELEADAISQEGLKKILDATMAERLESARVEGIRLGFEAAREQIERREHDDYYEDDKYKSLEDYLQSKKTEGAG